MARPKKKRRLEVEPGTADPQAYAALVRAVVEEQLPQETLDTAVSELLEEAPSKRDAAAGLLIGRLAEVDCLQLLAEVTQHTQVHELGSRPEFEERRPMLQHDVELVQAMLLRLPPEQIGGVPPNGAIVRDVLASAQDFSWYGKWARTRDTGELPSDEARRLQGIENIRIQTHAVRNWGALVEVERILSRLYEPLDHRARAEIGLPATDVLKLALGVLHLIQKRSDEFRQMALRVVVGGRPREAAERLIREAPSLEPEAEEIRARARAISGRGRRHAYDAIGPYLDRLLPELHTFSVAALAEIAAVDIEEPLLARVVDSWTLQLGATADTEPVHFLLDNPVWTAPLISVGEGSYFVGLPQLFQSFAAEIIGGVLAWSKPLHDRYLRRRGEFLEDAVEAVFRGAFPDAEVHRGTKWRDPDSGREYENDVLVVARGHAVVAEAKSGSMRAAARRGGQLSIERDARDMVIAPAEQSERFVTFLGAQVEPVLLGSISIDAPAIKRYSRITVTLELLGAWSRPYEMLSIGLADPESDLVAPISLADLELAAEVLPTAAELLHYLDERERVLRTMNVVGDDRDLLGIYLQDRIALLSAEAWERAHILGNSARLDEYLQLRSIGRQPAPPKRKLDRWWREVIDEAAKYDERVEVELLLLQAPAPAQQAVKKALHDLRRQIRKDGVNPGRESAAAVNVIHGGQPAVILAYAFSDDDPLGARQRAQGFLLPAMEEDDARNGVIIGSAARAPHDPFDFIFALLAPADG